MDVGRVRGLVPRAWYPFFGRFPQLTAIQREAVPSILAGENVLLASATATGKTEAYAGPLAERMLREGWAAPGVIIVSPTRALANDLFRRLEAPLAGLKIVLARKTGDHAEWDDKNPPAFCVTTPESLDSLLARRPEVLKTVRAIVLDELHVLDGTARGDQTAILVARLERLAMGVAAGAAARGRAVPLPLQRIAATATAAAGEEVATRYLGRGARVIATSERREIEADFVEGTDAKSMMAYFARLVKASRAGNGGRGVRKVLVFTNSRAEAENLAAACTGKPPFGTEVFVHHASLARNERERVEKRFLTAPSALCVATMTLELGIDIGDIDLVGLVGPPADVASLLQRVGRGNRRTWDVTRVACFYDFPGQRARFEHLLECARAGELHQGRECFRPSVLVQQAWSLAYQNRNRFVDAKTMHDRLPAWISGEFTVLRLEEMLAHLARDTWLNALSQGRYEPSDRLEALYVRGMIHSNIARDGGELEVVDAVTERVVGYLPMQKGPTATLPTEIVLGGQKRQVTRASGKRLRTAAAGVSAGATFKGQGSPSISYELAQSFAEHLGIHEQHLKIVRLEEKIVLAHFFGSCYGRLFLECVQRATSGLSGAGNAFVAVFTTTEMPSLIFREGDVLSEISKHRRALSSALQDGPYSNRLPQGWWHGWLCETLDVARFLTIVDTLHVDEEVTPALARVLTSLAPQGAALELKMSPRNTNT